MSAELLARLSESDALFPEAHWDLLAADHVPFDDLVPDGPRTEAAIAADARQDRCVAVVGGRGGGKTSVIARVSEDLSHEGFVPLRIGVLVAERDQILEPARFAQHAIREVLNAQQAKIEAWQKAGLVEATADELTLTPSEAEASAGVKAGLPPLEVELAGTLRTGTAQLLRDFDASAAAESLRRLVGIINFQDGEQGSGPLRPLFIIEDTDAWLGEPYDEELVEAFFQKDLRLLVNEVHSAALVAVHPDYEEATGYRAVQDRVGRVEIPRFPDPAESLERILEHRIRRGTGSGGAAEVFEPGAIEALASVYGDTGGNVRAALLVAHYSLQEQPGAEHVTTEAVAYARKTRLP